jgi:hypothetical protein
MTEASDNSGALHWFEDCPDRLPADDGRDEADGLRGDLAHSLAEVTCTRCYGDAVRMGLIVETTTDPPW